MTPPLRITHLVPAFSPAGGGITEAAIGLTRALQARPGIEVTVLSRERATDRTRWEPVPTGRFRFGNPRADIIHLHGLWTPLSTATWWAAPRTVVSPHGMLEYWALEQGSLKKKLVSTFLEHANVNRAGAVHALTRNEVGSVQRFAPSARTAVIPNGVDLAEARYLEDSKTLLYIGRLHRKKGLTELLEAWRNSAAPACGWTLVIAGWDDGGLLRALLEDPPVGVTFVGPKFGADKEALLASAAACILPSHSEGLPMAVLEAWAHRLPVIMTPACNLPEGVQSGAAIQCEPTPPSIAGALDRLVALDVGTRREMGRRGRQLVERDFTWAAIAEKFESLYLQIAGR